MIGTFEAKHERNLNAKRVAKELGMNVYNFREAALDAMIACFDECGTGHEHEDAHGLCHYPPLMQEAAKKARNSSV